MTLNQKFPIQNLSRPGSKSPIGHLFVLDLSGGRVFSLNTDGSDQKVIVTERRHPDGIVVYVPEAGHIYWTDMGVPNLNDGSIERADLDGRNRRTDRSRGLARSRLKQLYLDKNNGKLYLVGSGRDASHALESRWFED